MKKPVLEKDIRDPVVKWARANGFLVRKMNGQFNAGWPDDMFVWEVRRVAWIEFKRPGGETTTLQDSTIAKLRNRGHHVRVYSDAAKAIKWLEAVRLFPRIEDGAYIPGEMDL